MPLDFGSYTVTWKMDIDSYSPRAAAQQALAMLRDPECVATCFTVTDHSAASDPNPAHPYKVSIDLTYDEDPYDGLMEPCQFCGYLQCVQHAELRERI